MLSERSSPKAISEEHEELLEIDDSDAESNPHKELYLSDSSGHSSMSNDLDLQECHGSIQDSDMYSSFKKNNTLGNITQRNSSRYLDRALLFEGQTSQLAK